MSIYDPVFSDDDVKFLKGLELTCLAENKARTSSPVLDYMALTKLSPQGARYKLTQPTLVFMPHCDRYLYENILRENWGPHGLKNMILIANLLTEYRDK